MTITMASHDEEFSAQVVVRQTDYDLVTARAKLKEHNGDVVATIREYNGAAASVSDAPKTVNQRIYGEIRGLMDGAAAEHRRMSAEEQERQRKLEAFTKNAHMLAAITTPPQALRPGTSQGPLFSSDLASVDGCPTAFSILDQPPSDTGTGVWLLNACGGSMVAADVACAAREGGAAGVVVTADQPGTAEFIRGVKEAWDSCSVVVRVQPNGPGSLTTPVGSDPLSALETGRALRERGGEQRLCVVRDEPFDAYLKSVLEIQEAGAIMAITDPFYDIGTFLRFLVATRQAGITIPVCPCIKPISSAGAFETDAERHNIRVPPGVEAAVHESSGPGSTKKLLEYGLELARTATRALALRGVQLIHVGGAQDPTTVSNVITPLQKKTASAGSSG